MSPKAWRESLGYSQQQMDAFIGLNDFRWYRYETGRAVPSIDLIVLCEELSQGQITARSWFELSLSLPKLPPGRFYGNRRHGRHEAYAARA